MKILTGKDRGKTGKVLQVFTDRQKVSVEGLNLVIKHLRPRRQGEKGQRIEFPSPLAVSNIMLVCPKCGKGARVGYASVSVKKSATAADDTKETKKIRKCQKCRQTID